MTSRTRTGSPSPGISPIDTLTVVVNDHMLGNEMMIASTSRARTTEGLPAPARIPMRRGAGLRSAHPAPRKARRRSPNLALHFSLIHHH